MPCVDSFAAGVESPPRVPGSRLYHLRRSRRLTLSRSPPASSPGHNSPSAWARRLLQVAHSPIRHWSCGQSNSHSASPCGTSPTSWSLTQPQSLAQRPAFLPIVVPVLRCRFIAPSTHIGSSSGCAVLRKPAKRNGNETGEDFNPADFRSDAQRNANPVNLIEFSNWRV